MEVYAATAVFLTKQTASLHAALLRSARPAPRPVAMAACKSQKRRAQKSGCCNVLASDRRRHQQLLGGSTSVRTAAPSCGCATMKSSSDAAVVGAFSNQDGRRGMSISGCCSQPAAVNGRDDTRMSCPDLRLGPTPEMDIVISVFVELSVVGARRLRADPSLDLGGVPLLVLFVAVLVPAGTAAAAGISKVLAGKMEAAGPRRMCSWAIWCTAVESARCKASVSALRSVPAGHAMEGEAAYHSDRLRT
jgi:hypothetical protein